MRELNIKNCNITFIEKKQNINITSDKIDKRGYLTGKKVSPSDQSQLIKKLNLLIQYLEKHLKKKKKKTIDNHEKSRLMLYHFYKVLIKYYHE